MKDLTSWIALLFAAVCVIVYVAIRIGYDAGGLVGGVPDQPYEVRMLTVDLPPTAETVAVERELLNEMAVQALGAGHSAARSHKGGSAAAGEALLFPAGG